MYVCICNAVTEHAVREAAARGVDTLDALSVETGCGACCGSCRELAVRVLDQAIVELAATAVAA
jgi:bacterioferritin-associated ferredoxin